MANNKRLMIKIQHIIQQQERFSVNGKKFSCELI